MFSALGSSDKFTVCGLAFLARCVELRAAVGFGFGFGLGGGLAAEAFSVGLVVRVERRAPTGERDGRRLDVPEFEDSDRALPAEVY